jgi:hypothetical protein
VKTWTLVTQCLPLIINAHMKLLIALLQVPAYCLFSFALSSEAPPPCGSGMTPQEAYDRASAVFSGKVLAVEPRYTRPTRGGTILWYHEVRLEVEESWKLIDRRTVTLRTASTTPGTCGSFAQGETYLIYADHLNDDLHVSSASRTNRLSDASEDLKVLGKGRVELRPGEFQTHYVFVYGIVACVALALIIALFVYRLYKKPFRANGTASRHRTFWNRRAKQQVSRPKDEVDPATRNYYQILGIDPKATEGEIKRAYKKFARIYHPDLNPKRPRSAEDRFRRLQEAYDVLSDPVSRQRYDQSLGIAQINPQTSDADTDTTSGSRTVHIDLEETRAGWLGRFNWRRKLAVVIWALCVLGSFLPTSTSAVVFGARSVRGFSLLSTTQRLVLISLPLAAIWVGSWMSNEDNFDDDRPVLKVFGILLELNAWIWFVSQIGFYFLGPLILLVS